MQHAFFISAPPFHANLQKAFDAISRCTTNKTTIKQIFMFNDAAQLFEQPTLKDDWLALLKRTQSDVIICSKALKSANLDPALLPDFISIAGMASFVESINNQVHVASFGAFEILDTYNNKEQGIEKVEQNLPQCCNLAITADMQKNHIQAAIDMANVLLVFGYSVNFVIKGSEPSILKQAHSIDAQLLDAAYFIASFTDKTADKNILSTNFKQLTYQDISHNEWPKHKDFKNTTLAF